MIVIIDPDVFVSAVSNENCAKFIAELYKRIQSGQPYELACDKGRKLGRAYNDLPLKIRRGKCASELVQKFIGQLLVVDGSLPIHETDTSVITRSPQINQACGIAEPESLLVSIAEAINIEKGNDEELIIVLSSETAVNRKLTSQPVIEAFWKNHINIDVRYASDVKTQYPLDSRYEGSWQVRFHSRIFELLVTAEILKLYPDIHVVEYQPDDLGLQKNQEVDFVGFSSEKSNIWVGECKLRAKNDAYMPFGTCKNDKVLQTADKIRRIREKFPEQTVVPFFVCNAIDINSDTLRLLLDNGFKYFQANLSNEWWVSERWKIETLTEML